MPRGRMTLGCSRTAQCAGSHGLRERWATCEGGTGQLSAPAGHSYKCCTLMAGPPARPSCPRVDGVQGRRERGWCQSLSLSYSGPQLRASPGKWGPSSIRPSPPHTLRLSQFPTSNLSHSWPLTSGLRHSQSPSSDLRHSRSPTFDHGHSQSLTYLEQSSPPTSDTPGL